MKLKESLRLAFLDHRFRERMLVTVLLASWTVVAVPRSALAAEIPPELANPNYRISDVTGIGYDAQWERCDPSNVVKVGDTYCVWYTRWKARTELYAGAVYFATSKDGRCWTERGEAIGKGHADAWDNFGVITPYIVVRGGKYHLYYTGSRKLPGEPWTVRGKNNKRHIGLAIADSPNGPWKKLPQPVLSPGEQGTWDSYLVDDTHVIVREGKFWLYYKGGTPKVTAYTTKWGLAIADEPTGPFVKYKENPVLGSGHCVCVWPHRKGVAALVDNAGPERFTVQYAADGTHFQRTAKLEHVDIGCAPYDPDAFTNTAYGGGISWGVTARRKNGLTHIVRFDVDCLAPPAGAALLPDVGATVASERSRDHLAYEERNGAIVRLEDHVVNDPLRPAYHFVTPAGDSHPFDPNGAVYWKGRYHLFYIFQRNHKGDHCWGHASSEDLLHWKLHPTALTPGQGDDRVYSGNLFLNKEGVPTIIYNGGKGVCIANSTDDHLNIWKKHPGNPVIRGGSDVHAWLETDTYYALKGTTLFRSTNLTRWEDLGVFFRDKPEWKQAGPDVSCGDFFPSGDKHVLVFMSHPYGTQYYMGEYRDRHFYPECHGRMNWKGGTLVSPESVLDDRGRRILWNWACESRTGEAQKAAGWSGVYTLPRLLSIGKDGTLQIQPVEEVATLRRNHRRFDGLLLAEGGDLSLPKVRGNCLELAMVIQPQASTRFGIKLLASSDGKEETAVTFDFAKQTVSVDCTRASLGKDIYHPFPHPWSAHHPMGGMYGKEDARVQTAPLGIRNGQLLGLRLFLDRSILELYVDQGPCLTQRVYPTRADAKNIVLFSTGGSTKVLRVDAWDIAATNSW